MGLLAILMVGEVSMVATKLKFSLLIFIATGPSNGLNLPNFLLLPNRHIGSINMQWCQWKPASLFSVVLQTKISLVSMNFKMASGTCSGIIILYEEGMQPSTTRESI